MTYHVSETKWRDAIKFLLGLGCNPTLTSKDQRQLGELLRGPFANGFPDAEAAKNALSAFGWSKD